MYVVIGVQDRTHDYVFSTGCLVRLRRWAGLGIEAWGPRGQGGQAPAALFLDPHCLPSSELWLLDLVLPISCCENWGVPYTPSIHSATLR